MSTPADCEGCKGAGVLQCSKCSLAAHKLNASQAAPHTSGTSPIPVSNSSGAAWPSSLLSSDHCSSPCAFTLQAYGRAVTRPCQEWQKGAQTYRHAHHNHQEGAPVVHANPTVFQGAVHGELTLSFAHNALHHRAISCHVPHLRRSVAAATSQPCLLYITKGRMQLCATNHTQVGRAPCQATSPTCEKSRRCSLISA